MIFAVRDLFEVGLAPPPDTTPPAFDSPWFTYLVRRLLASFNLPGGPLKYLSWMGRADVDSWLGRGVAHWTARVEWPRIKSELDRGKLASLGLVRVRSTNPWKLGENHQVLAYGYDLNNVTGDWMIHVYDPNHPDREDVTLAFNLNSVTSVSRIVASTGEPVRGFFRTPYRPLAELRFTRQSLERLYGRSGAGTGVRRPR
jgi:hypothetical protein